MYQSDSFQMVVAFFILAGFLVDILESQLMPVEGSKEVQTFLCIDFFITGVFVIELVINLFAHSNDGFKPFCCDRSNWFDATIVLVSVINVVFVIFGWELPNAKLLRLMRIGRVVRLFKAFKDLQRLIDACTSAILPVCNAFLILLIISAVYAILGTNFFASRQPIYFRNFHTYVCMSHTLTSQCVYTHTCYCTHTYRYVYTHDEYIHTFTHTRIHTGRYLPCFRS